MATTLSRHGNYARPPKSLPISPPTKTSNAYHHPLTRAAAPDPELDETSTIYSSSRSGGTFSDISGDDYASSYKRGGIDVMDELSERMNTVFDPSNMDRMVARQAQGSGQLNAKQRELAELQAQMQKRMRRTRVNFDAAVDSAAEARKDIDYTSKKMAAMKAKTLKANPELLEQAREYRRERVSRR